MLHYFGIGSPTHLKLNIYVRTTPQGSSSHALKDFPLWRSFTKRLLSFHNGIHNNLHILFLQGFLFTYNVSTSLDLTNNMQLLNANYKSKAPISTPYILERKTWMNTQPHSFTSIPHVSNQSWSATYNFSSFMDRFYIIWTLGFGQVYILDLPLLLT
jgi:hypothetical protein